MGPLQAEGVLKGGDHTSALYHGLQQLRGGGEVLLVGEESSLACHGLLLAAASPLLREVLQPGRQGVVILPGASTHTITALVNLLYGAEAEEGLGGGEEELQEVMGRLGIQPLLAKLEAVLTFSLPGQEGGVKEEDSGMVPTDGCAECGDMFPSEDGLREHKCREQGGHRCDECGMDLATLASLEVHTRSHTGEKPFVCDECEKTFASMHYLVQHKDFHRTTKDFECDICAKKYQTLNALSQHKADFHSGGLRYRCELCPGPKTFSAKRYLKEHERKKHVSLVSFDCDICGKSLAGKNELKIHSRIHTGEKPFHCKDCNKDFRARSTYMVHMKSHSGTKNAVCEECGKRFIQWGDLHKHKRTHTGERPFKCDICGRTFARKDYLTKHQRTHKDDLEEGRLVERVEVTSLVSSQGRELVLSMEDMVGGEGGLEGGLQVVTLLEGEGGGLSLEGEGGGEGESVYYIVSG